MIFRYPGGKSTVVKKIVPFFPPSYDEYREPMVGGGGVFWSIPTNKRRWINDLDSGLMAVYLSLRDRPDQFIKLCKDIPAQSPADQYAPVGPKGKKLACQRLVQKFHELAYNTECDQALRFLFLNRTIWMGRVIYDWPEGCKKSRVFCSCTEGWNIVKTDKLEKAADILRNVKITCGSYQDVLFQGGDNVLCYLDPPYYKETGLSRTNKLYANGFEVKDHEELSSLLKQCSHKFVLSYDDCDEIRRLYGWANIHIEQWVYRIDASSETKTHKQRTGKELIITNF